METSPGRRRASSEDLLVVLLTGLFAAGLVFTTPTLRESSDYLVIWRPSFRFLMDALAGGRLPLWNPYLNLGRPYLADMPNMAFYPPTYLICLGEGVGFFLQVWLHCLLAVFGMRKLAGVLGVGRWQAYFMASTFVASGALTARWAAGHLPNCWAICYVPWLLYCAARTTEAWQGRRMAWYAVLLALQLLCHPQVFWFSAIGQAVFIVARAVRLPMGEALRDVGRGLWQLGVGCVWCAGLLAVALMPFRELVKESNRSASSAVFANAFNLDLRDLWSLFGPLQAGAVWETNFFVGTLVVLLGVAGLCRVRERNVRGLLGLLVIGVLIALGDQTPFFGLFYKWLPGYAGFRFHSRAAVLAVVALICAAGIWLSRPHPLLRALWTYLVGVPVRYAIVLLILVQSLDLLQGTWMIKKVVLYACCLAVGTPSGYSYEQTLVAELRKADLMKASQPPPRVCVPPSMVPAACGMIYQYSHFDAGCPLALRRPWDYLHAVLGITPNAGKGELPVRVYELGPFPYPDLNLSAGFDPRTSRIVVATNASPRAFLVYAAEVVGDYDTILERLAGHHDVHRCALLERPLPEPLPQTSALPGTAAAITRFEPNWLAVDIQAQTNALLVLAEAWHPGWRAAIDGRPAPCVPANTWMRAVPVPAGHHRVLVYFRQNYLLAGFLMSLASLALLLVAAAKPGHRLPPSPRQGDASHLPAPSPAGGSERLDQPAERPAGPSGPFSAWRPLLRALAAACVLVLVWRVAAAETRQLRLFETRKAELEALVQCRRAGALVAQRQIDRATAHFVEALHLAQRACELTGYGEPMQLGTLACVYADVGRFDEALATAKKGRSLALATGQADLAEKLRKIIEGCNARKSTGKGEPK